MQDRTAAPLNRIFLLSLILILSLVSSGLLSCSEPPVINSFNASPTAITSGQAVTLQWDVSGTNVVNISGVGDVAPSGKAIVIPRSTTTYVLTVPKSTQSLSVTINVQSTEGRKRGAAGGHKCPSAGNQRSRQLFRRHGYAQI